MILNTLVLNLHLISTGSGTELWQEVVCLEGCFLLPQISSLSHGDKSEVAAVTIRLVKYRSRSLPPAMQRVRDAAFKALGALKPAAAPKSQSVLKGFILSSRTLGRQDLPPYYLVYFLLVDLLGFPKLGKWEKVAWKVPVIYRGRLYGIEHRKMGLGIFAPNLDPNATMSTAPSEEAESDAREIALLIKKGVAAAEPYFEWRAEQAAAGVDLNVVNNCDWLFDRYEFFRDRFKALSSEAGLRKSEKDIKEETLEDGTVVTTWSFPSSKLLIEAEWNAQAAVEAFFSWTEHVFIHLAILQGRLQSGEDVASMAGADWKSKFKAALDVSDAQTKKYYDNLLGFRAQIRNFMAHGAFGKRGEAFRFHSDAGAVPVLLTGRQKHRYSLTGDTEFDESSAIREIEKFINHLWSGSRMPARHYVHSGLPSILPCVADGTYARAMQSVDDMKVLTDHLTREFDNAANMDW